MLPQRPAELERLEREVHLSLGNAFYLHHRLRPIFREVASNRLLVRHGVDSTAPRRGDELVGPEAWEWLRPERPEPRDRWAPGPPFAELSSVVARLRGFSRGRGNDDDR